MGLYEHWPYVNFHELNMDWIIQLIKAFQAEYAQFKIDWANIQDDWEAQQQAFQALQQFVTDYFDNLDVQQEINNKLDEMAENGTLWDIMEPYVDEQLDEIRVYVTPEMYGAKGDGTTVDSSAINSAILKCAEDKLPLVLTGEYLVDYNEPVTISGVDNLTIIGKNAVIKLKDQETVEATGKYYLIEIIDSHKIDISGVTFNGNRDHLGLSDPDTDKPNHLADGIYIEESSDIYIHDCSFKKIIAFGIYCMSSVSMSYTDPNISKLKIVNNYFEYCMNAAKILEGISDTIEFSDNICMKMDTHGVSFYPTATNVIVNNNIIEAGVVASVIVAGSPGESGCGIRLYETNNVVVDGNIILSAYIAGVMMEIKPSSPVIPSNITIVNNQILEVRNGQGVYVKGSNFANIENNIIKNTYTSGIYLVGNNGNVKNNQLKNITADNTQALVVQGNKIQIVGNTIDECENHGIRVSGGPDNVVNENVVIGGNNMLNGVNIPDPAIIGMNYISNYINAPYFENAENVKYTTPRMIAACEFEIPPYSQGVYNIYGTVNSLPEFKIPVNCTIVGLYAYVKDATTAGSLEYRIYKNGTLLPNTELTPNLSSVQTVETEFKKGRKSPYVNFRFDKGEILKVSAWRDTDYAQTTTGALVIIFDCDR